MPYITKENREKVLNWGVEPEDMSPGQHNFLITELVNSWLGEDPDYSTYERVMGRLELIKLEIWRRRVVPYEDQKRIKNGDLEGFKEKDNGCTTSVDPTLTNSCGPGCCKGPVRSGPEEVVGTDGGRGDQA